MGNKKFLEIIKVIIELLNNIKEKIVVKDDVYKII